MVLVVKTCLPIQETLKDIGLIPGLGRSRREGKGYPFQYWPGEFYELYNPWGLKESEILDLPALIFTIT